MADPAATANSRSGIGVVICVSRTINVSDKSFPYMCKIEDNQMGQGNPVHLINPKSRMNLWRNSDLRRGKLTFGEIVRFRIDENEYVYDGKTENKTMVSYGKSPLWATTEFRATFEGLSHSSGSSANVSVRQRLVH